MAKQTLNTIKSWFKTGFKPTQQQFWDTWDSFWHKDEVIPAANIENLDTRFSEKADAEALASHLRDLSAHGLNDKAGLKDINTFTGSNSFEQDIKVPRLKTDTGIDFNLGIDNKVSNPGFTAFLDFNNSDGTMALKTSAKMLNTGEKPLYQNTMTISNNGDMVLPGNLNAHDLSLSTEDNYNQHIKTATVTEDTTFSLPQKSGTLARVEDTPVLKAGTNIRFTGTYPEVVIHAESGSAGAEPKSITYTDFVDAIVQELLIPGQQYKMTDFQSTFVYATHTKQEASEGQPGWESLYYSSEVYSGPVEPLIITAISSNEFLSLVRSETYPEDLIIYTTNNMNRGILASTKGTILKRTDQIRNNTANFDYRVTMYKTNGGDPKSAISLGTNCTINAIGQYDMLIPVVVNYMNNSTIISYYGDLIADVYDSYLDQGYAQIVCSNINIHKCDIRGALLSLNDNYGDRNKALYGIYARTNKYGNSMNNEAINAYLIGKSYYSSTFIMGGSDGDVYLIDPTKAGITATSILNPPN